MARKHKHPEHVNHERWLVSYADFVTLLFAFFVVMFAVSQVDSNKLGRFTTSTSAVATDIKVFAGQTGGVMGGGQAKKGEVSKIVNMVDQKKAGRVGAKGTGGAASMFGEDKSRLEESLLRNLGDVAFEGVSVQEVKGELVVRLADRLMFEQGGIRLEPEGYMALEIIASELKDQPLRLRIEGHTDDSPVENKRLGSNWELSTERALECLHFYVQNRRIDPKRLSAAGYANYKPVTKDRSPAGRARNRRVEIVVTPDSTFEEVIP